MVTTLAMHIIQKVCLCTADCNLGYMNETLFVLIAFDYLILFCLEVSEKYQIFLRNLIFLSFVSMVTTEDSGGLLFPIGYRQIA